MARFGEYIEMKTWLKRIIECPACEIHAGFRGLCRAVAGHLSTFKVVAEQTVGINPKPLTTGSFQRCESIGKQPNAGK